MLVLSQVSFVLPYNIYNSISTYSPTKDMLFGLLIIIIIVGFIGGICGQIVSKIPKNSKKHVLFFGDGLLYFS